MRSYNETRRRPRVQTVNNDPEVTVQADGPRSDIREILKKYRQVGIIDQMRQVDLTYRDVSEFEDYTDMVRQTKFAEAAFMKLPPAVRDVFGNSVFEWLDAAHDVEKFDALRPKLEKLGVLESKAPAAPEAPAPAPV